MRLLSVALPYILLVSFYSGSFEAFDFGKIHAVNSSSYHGVAVPLVGAYSMGSFQSSSLKKKVALIAENTEKHIWPWVFFNRFIGYEQDGRPADGRKMPFSSINAMDIYNTTGDLDAFLILWRASLEIARELGAPGIVVDPEAYNNPRVYKVSYLAGKLGRPEEEIRLRLKEVGRQLAKIAARTYPDATIWFLFTGIGDEQKKFKFFKSGEKRSISYIVRGMLEETVSGDLGLKIVSGGELSLGYCYESLADMKEKIYQRQRAFAGALGSYPALSLAGSIAPWRRLQDKRPPYTKNRCGRAMQASLGEFKPLIGRLMDEYDYVWIYAASKLGYNPYDLSSAKVYNYAIRSVLEDKTIRMEKPAQ